MTQHVLSNFSKAATDVPVSTRASQTSVDNVAAALVAKAPAKGLSDISGSLFHGSVERDVTIPATDMNKAKVWFHGFISHETRVGFVNSTLYVNAYLTSNTNLKLIFGGGTTYGVHSAKIAWRVWE